MGHPGREMVLMIKAGTPGGQAQFASSQGNAKAVTLAPGRLTLPSPVKPLET